MTQLQGTEIRSAVLGRVLCFAPHPDDEVLGAGGTLHLCGAAGGTVHVALATDGVYGDPDKKFDEDSFAERRREESRRGLAALGIVREPSFWALPDNSEAREEDLVRLTRLVVEEIEGFSPDVVLAPWSEDHNDDHRVLHQVVVRGLREIGFVGEALGYEVWAPIPRPDVVVDITAVVELKRAALNCYESQNAYGDLSHPCLGMNAYRSLLLERASSYGEAFATIAF